MEAFKCNKCKKFYEFRAYGKIKLHVNITKDYPSSFTVFEYDVCNDCFFDLKDDLGIPIREMAGIIELN